MMKRIHLELITSFNWGGCNLRVKFDCLMLGSYKCIFHCEESMNHFAAY